MSPTDTHATQTQSVAASGATNSDQAHHQTQLSALSATPRLVSPSAAPATQSAAASRATNGDQARHQTQPSAVSATPATQN